MKILKISLSILAAITLVILVIPMFFTMHCPPMDYNAANLRAISSALKLFKLDTGRYPTEAEGLDILTGATDSRITGYKSGGYIEDLPSDIWGNQYRYYRYKLESGEDAAMVWTFGADNLPNGADGDKDIFVSVLLHDNKN